MILSWFAAALLQVQLYTAPIPPPPPPPDVSALSSSGACRDAAIRYLERNGLQLAYTVDGLDDGRPLILVGGTDQQITDWPKPLVDGLVQRGFRVVRYDARDVGCSTHLSHAKPVDWTAVFNGLATGSAIDLPYHASDLSMDLIAVMDELAIDSAHLIGVSGGATVAAIAAAGHPARVGPLTLLMAHSGEAAHKVPADPAKLSAVPAAPTATAPLEDIVRYRVAAAIALEGTSIRRSRQDIEEWAAIASARSYDPAGVARTGAALLSHGSMRPTLTAIKSRTLVIHGSDDPLIPHSSGRAVAGMIPDAMFVLLAGLGHSLPDAAIPRLLAEFDRLDGKIDAGHPEDT